MRLEPIRVTTGLVLAVVAGIALAAGMRTCTTLRDADDQHSCRGIVQRGSLVSATPANHRFTLAPDWGDVPMCRERTVDVRYRGPLPDTLCEGVEVLVRGYVAGEHFEATQVYGRAASKYDACWHPCRGKPPPGCPERDVFE